MKERMIAMRTNQALCDDFAHSLPLIEGDRQSATNDARGNGLSGPTSSELVMG